MKKNRTIFNTGLFVWLCAAVLIAGCKKTSTEPEKQTQTPASPVTDSRQKPEKNKEKKAKAPSTISDHSLAFFGDLGRREIRKPVKISPQKRASVLLLVFDALNVQHLSAYGYKRNTSPTIDSVAEDGLLLTNYHSNSSWTRPSFTTIITGVPKSVHGVELRGGWLLEPHLTTLAERFKKAGYRTAGYTGNPLVRKAWGFSQGFDVYRGPTTEEGIRAFPRDGIWVNMAIEWLESSGDRPFFLMMFLTSTHPPYTPPAEPRKFLGSVPKGRIIEHPYKEYKEPLEKDMHDRIVAAYDDEIAYMDTQVKRLLDHLEKTGQIENTIIAMTADHGEMMGEHNCYLHAYHMWQQTLRVPFIIKAPNIPLENAVDDRPFTHVDIAPTLLQLSGIQYDVSTLKGESIVAALADLKLNRKRILMSQYNAHGVRREAFMNGKWKLIHHHQVARRAADDLDELHPSVKQADPRNLPSLAWDGERFEMYRLDSDPGEKNNIIASQKTEEPGKTLLEALKRYLGEKEEIKGEVPEEVIQALKNAGYIR